MAKLIPSASKSAKGALIVYFAAAALWILPVLDLSAIAFPFLPKLLDWRFGFASMLSQTLTTQILAIGLLVLSAHIREDSGFGRFLALACLGYALVLAAVLAMFLLDGLQIRPTVPPANLAKFHFTVAKTALQLSIGLFVMAGMGVVSWRHLVRGGDRLVGGEAKTGGSKGVVLIGGSPRASE